MDSPDLQRHWTSDGRGLDCPDQLMLDIPGGGEGGAGETQLAQDLHWNYLT